MMIYTIVFFSNGGIFLPLLAMAEYFTAVVRAPITGTILITEMTGSCEMVN